ncbi:MAG: T9SS type A sorting domain-containing protein, partial [Bacteroidota bacterium]
PGGGICLKNFTFNISANQVIVRHIRSRFGDEGTAIDDALNGYSGTPHAKKNIIIDHCSASWSIDESLSFYGYDSSTVQWCLIGESLYNNKDPKGTHGYGGIWGGYNTTFHHNLLAHHSSRNPRFSGATPAGSGTVYSQNLDFRNNVIYNWGFNSSYGAESSFVNIVGNYYKPGPATKSSVKTRIFNPSGVYDSSGVFYINGNVMEGDTAVTNDNWKGVFPQVPTQFTMAKSRALIPFAVPEMTAQTAQEAYALVLKNAGATLPRRDTVDKRIVYETANKTALFSGHSHLYEKSNNLDTNVAHGIIDSQTDVGGWPVLVSGISLDDTDHDGMPDVWETGKGLNPNDAADRNNIGPGGYTRLEEYLNSITELPMSVGSEPSSPKHFALLESFPNPFNPSTVIRYSVLQRGSASLKIYDTLGREVAVLEHEVKEPGEYQRSFQPPSSLTSGTYFCRFDSGETHRTIKLVYLR